MCSMQSSSLCKPSGTKLPHLSPMGGKSNITASWVMLLSVDRKRLDMTRPLGKPNKMRSFNF